MLQAMLRTEEVCDAGRRHVPVVPRPAAGVDAGDEDLLQSANEAVLDCAARAELAAEGDVRSHDCRERCGGGGVGARDLRNVASVQERGAAGFVHGQQLAQVEADGGRRDGRLDHPCASVQRRPDSSDPLARPEFHAPGHCGLGEHQPPGAGLRRQHLVVRNVG